MLEIHYAVVGDEERVKNYPDAKSFISAQLLEVPDLQDNFKVKKVLLDGKELQLPEATIGGLFNYLQG